MDEQRQNSEYSGPLIDLLESAEVKERIKARKLLVAIGKPAVPSLSQILENSKVYKARWEAAKALGAIGDAKAIPSLIKALEDPESDVAWLAAKALEKFKKAAWPQLLSALIKRGSESILLQHGAHHVFRYQKNNKFKELLEVLQEALESKSVPESIPVAAYNILEKLKVQVK